MLTIGDIISIGEQGGNVAEYLDEETLRRVGRQCLDQYKRDCESREGWNERYDKAIKLAMQTVEAKTFPWQGASNIKFPLITVATQQFASRVFPALVKMPYPVSGRINGFKTQAKVEASDRMSRHMSYQLTDEMPDWVEDQDKLCHVLPIVGCAFKKTYRDSANNRNVSELVMPDRLVFDYYADDIETARSVTHWFYLYPYEIEENRRLGVYRDVEISEDSPNDGDFDTRDAVNDTDYPQRDAPVKLFEHHSWYDLDGDGKEEPYIITLSENGTVLRISPRYDGDSVIVRGDRVAKITPTPFFTQYVFFPDPSGGNLGIGWGTILMPINETVNTLMNQLVDSGTLENTGGGMFSSELRIKSGDIRRKPGGWIRVDNIGGDLAKSVYPWPQQPPSQVLYMLMTLLIDWGQRITAVTDAMVGESPPSNVPATTTLAMLEQGQKVFQGIYQRMYRAMARELRKLKALNAKYMDPVEYYRVLDNGPIESIGEEELDHFAQTGSTPASAGMAYRTDYNRDDTDVTLTAEQQLSSEQIAMFRMQMVMQMQQAGIQIQPQYIERQLMMAMGLPESEKGSVLVPPQQGPTPEQLQMMEMQMGQEQANRKLDIEEARVAVEDKRIDTQAKVQSDKDRVNALLDSRGLDIQEMKTVEANNAPNKI